MRLKVYGCRGSSPVSLTRTSKYGGNTICIKLTSGGGTLILDAGSGLLTMEELPPPVNILLGHLHLDHTVGLGTYPPAWAKNGGVRVFTCDRTRQDMKAQVFGSFKPPYWPVPMDMAASAEVITVEHETPFCPDGVFTVLPFFANHPDKTLSFKISDGEKTLVYLVDYEIDTLPEGDYRTLAERCKNADLIICDATYHPDDYPAKRGWGHSAVPHGVKLADDCGCGQMLFTHFSFDYTDRALDTWQKLLDCAGSPKRFILSHDGMELEI